MKLKAAQTASAPATSFDARGWPGGIPPATAPFLARTRLHTQKLTARFLAVVKPTDFVEEVLLRDAIDLSWEILRLRRMKAGLLRVTAGGGVRRNNFEN